MEGPPTQAEVTPRLNPTPAYWGAIAVALVAVAVSLAWPDLLDTVPVGGLWANLALLAGLLGLFLLLFEDQQRPVTDRLIPVIAAALPAAVLARLLYMDPGSSQTVALHEAAVPEVLIVATVLLASWAALRMWPQMPRMALLVVGVLGGLTSLVIALVHVDLARPLPAGASVVLGVTGVVVAAGLAIQWAVARQARDPRTLALATPAGLAVVAGHLLDGVVSYLAVVDPLGVLTQSHGEGVVVSRVILETAGPLFPVVKWLVAAAAVALLEHDAQATAGQATHGWMRTAILVLVLFVGMGPGIYSATQVLYGA